MSTQHTGNAMINSLSKAGQWAFMAIVVIFIVTVAASLASLFI